MVPKMKNITTFDFTSLNQYKKIFCLVSGGIDSTYLFEMIKQSIDLSKIFPTNCFNPFESSTTLNTIKQNTNFISIKPDSEYNYGQILKNAFLNLPKSFQMRKYSKKVFECCYYIKHKAFMNNPIFSESNSVVISGIKYNDGMQRRMFLKSLIDGKERSKGVKILNFPTFYHIHKNGQNYCYPFRDYLNKDLPVDIVAELRNTYPNLTHSGCSICPVLLRFEKRILKSKEPFDLIRLNTSIEYAKRLNVYHIYK